MQDDVDPRTQGTEKGRPLRSAVTAIRRLELLPQTPALGPVHYTAGLVTYVAARAAAAVIVGLAAVLWVRVPVDLVTVAIAGTTIFLMSVFAIKATPAANVAWVPSPYIHLGLSVTFGPAGAGVGALAEPIGISLRTRNGWFRTSFNIADYFLANVAAWGVFQGVHGLGVGGVIPLDLVAGLAAGLVHFTVNSGLVAMVIRLSD